MHAGTRKRCLLSPAERRRPFWQALKPFLFFLFRCRCSSSLPHSFSLAGSSSGGMCLCCISLHTQPISRFSHLTRLCETIPVIFRGHPLRIDQITHNPNAPKRGGTGHGRHGTGTRAQTIDRPWGKRGVGWGVKPARIGVFEIIVAAFRALRRMFPVSAAEVMDGV